MIRLFSIEVALFLAPFVAYGLFLWAMRKGVLHPDAWPSQILIGLTAAALVLTAAGFVVVAEFSGAPPGSTYVPAHMEDGHLVPGTLK
jgi:hypothetical protein